MKAASRGGKIILSLYALGKRGEGQGWCVESQADLVKALSDTELCSSVPEEHLQKNQSRIFSLAPHSLIPFCPTRQPGRSTQPWPTHSGHFQEYPVNTVLTLRISSLQKWGRCLRFVSLLLACSRNREPQQLLKASIRNATTTLPSPPSYRGTRLHISWNITTKQTGYSCAELSVRSQWQ